MHECHPAPERSLLRRPLSYAEPVVVGHSLRLMRVVTWNVQHGVPAAGGVPDVLAAVEPLRALRAEVLALQELDRGWARSARVDQPGLFAERLGMSLAFGSAFRRNRADYGIALLTSGGLDAVELLRLPGRGEPRVAVLAEVAVGDRRWSVATAHLANRGRDAGDQVLVVLDALGTRPRPRVLLGDLNIPTERLLPWTSAEGYALAPTGPTFPARSPSRRIDHIGVFGARITGHDTVRLPLSDHLAVVADLI
jgi:endonuclease/exonuclease/phosphatase family metal-dependent hydrolase